MKMIRVTWMGDGMVKGMSNISKDVIVDYVAATGAVFGGFVALSIVARGVDGNFDSNSPAANFFALKSLNRFFLLFFPAHIDKAVALALPGLTPPPANDAGGIDSKTSVSEERRKTSIIDVEAQIGNEQHGRGGLASRILASRTRGTRCPGLASTRRLLGLRGLGGLSLSNRGRFRDVSLSLGLGLAL